MSRPFSSADIRQAFINYFAENGHTPVASSSLVPHNDPTLLFTNAGMNQFKDVFLGIDKRDYKRAVSSQKCVRAGGKHNDLDNVGYTARHHTFFEMLGNFSFGDYFKQQAIPFCWEFLTSDEWLGLPKDKLYVTVYHTDDEAFDIWHNVVGLPAERIIRIGDNKGGQYQSDNFWAMGDTGPCGPCTEVFYDHGEHIWGGLPGTPEEDGDRFVEIWNNVFMQFNRQKDGTLEKLPAPSVDTGMGLERISAIMQGVHSNYEIDMFTHLMQHAAQVIGLPNDIDLQSEPSLKVLADHIRSVSFLIADGVLPSNEGRGYVLRRIIRRAVRHGHKMGAREPFFHKLVATLDAEMGQAYPELIRAEALITETLKLEEGRFRTLLGRGLGRAVVRRDLVVELRLDPARVHAERRVGGVGELGRERRILDDDAVERQHRRHALDDGLVQRAERVAVVVGVVDARAFDHQHVAFRVLRQIPDRCRRQFGQARLAARILRALVFVAHVVRFEQAEDGRQKGERDQHGSHHGARGGDLVGAGAPLAVSIGLW